MPAEKGIASPFGLRVPPHDLPAEQALLGSLMVKPDSIHDASDVIKADAFYAEKHRLIFETIIDLAKKGEPVDLLSVSSRLKEKKMLDRIGGSTYLAELSGSVPSATNARYYAEIIHRKYVLRNLISAADHIAEIGYNDTGDLDKVLDIAGKKILDIATYSKRKVVTLKDTLLEAWERLDRLHKSKEEIRGVPTGFPELDNKLAGLQKSDLIILAARPSMGKTSLALDIARKTALDHGTTVGIFSLEMSAQQLVDRMLASESRVDSWKLRTGKLSTDDEFSLIRDSLEKLSKAPIFIDDDSNTDIMRMRSTARRLKNDHNLGLIIVDYLQLMVPRDNRQSLVEQVTDISRSLKGIARELDVPVLALSQLNRNVEQRGGRPRLSDLRDSGSIEQDADVVMFIHREDKGDGQVGRSNVAEIMIEKHRNGPTGKVDLYFDDRRVSFSTMEKSSFGDI